MSVPLRALAASCVLSLTAGAGQSEPPSVRPLAQISHGAEVESEKVGPEAAGISTAGTYSGTVLRDGQDYPFAVDVPHGAEYGGIPVEGPHLLIAGAHIAGGLDIYTGRTVVLLGSIVRPERDANAAIHTRPGAGRLYMLWSEAGGARGARTEVGLLLRADGAVVHRSHVSQVLDGIRLTASGHRITQSLIDGLEARPKDHNDGIQTSPQARNIVIEQTRIINPNPQTSCILIRGNGISIEKSYLAGGGWVLYGGANGNGHGGESSAGLTVRDTIFGTDFFSRSGHFGPVTYWNAAGGNAWQGNRYPDGAPVTPGRQKAPDR